MNTKAKILKIVNDDLRVWKAMTHEQLLDLLTEKRIYELETEVEYGNEEYLDELLEEIED